MTLTVDQMLRSKSEERMGVIWVPPDATVLEALALMDELDIGAVVVMRRECVLGIFTHKDNSLRVTRKHRNPDTTKVDEVMTSFGNVDPLYVVRESELEDCIDLMRSKGVNHLVVMEGGGECGQRVIGVISNKDITDALSRRKHLNDNILENLPVS